MTISRPNLVRLIAAVMGMTASVWFVVTYTDMSYSRFKFEHEGGRLIAINEVLVPYGSWLYLWPAIVLPIGLWLIYRRPNASATLEIVLSGTWLLALALAGFCILIWQVQNVPTFSHMEWHF
jgi:hypothetical protein